MPSSCLKLFRRFSWGLVTILVSFFWGGLLLRDLERDFGDWELVSADKSYRSIPVESAQYIANKLIQQWFIPYEVIKPWEQPVLNWCQILDTPEMRFVVALCARYPVFWCDSSLHHAAKAFNKKATVVWAGTDAERYGYESNNNLREFPMVMHTPLRLFLNSFNDDVSNQYTNKFTQEFLDKVIETFISSLQINENNNWAWQCCWNVCSK